MSTPTPASRNTILSSRHRSGPPSRTTPNPPLSRRSVTAARRSTDGGKRRAVDLSGTAKNAANVKQGGQSYRENVARTHVRTAFGHARTARASGWPPTPTRRRSAELQGARCSRRVKRRGGPHFGELLVMARNLVPTKAGVAGVPQRFSRIFGEFRHGSLQAEILMLCCGGCRAHGWRAAAAGSGAPVPAATEAKVDLPLRGPTSQILQDVCRRATDGARRSCTSRRASAASRDSSLATRSSLPHDGEEVTLQAAYVRHPSREHSAAARHRCPPPPCPNRTVALCGIEP